MKQNYYEINKSVNQYNEKIVKEKFGYGQIQKIYSTPHLICFIVRYPGLNRYLYIGRGSNYEGLWEGIIAPPSDIRIKDKYLEYLRKKLLGLQRDF